MVKDIFLKELKTMDLAELRTILRGGDFIVTPDLLPANPYRPFGEQPLVNGEDSREHPLVNGKAEPDENQDVEGEDLKPFPKKNDEDGGLRSGVDTPRVAETDESCFTGLGDDEKRRLEEALAALEAKEAEEPQKDDDEEEMEMMDPERRKLAIEAAMRSSIDALGQRLDELDGEAERLQAEGFQEMLEANLEEATSQLDSIEKNLAETQEEINRLRSNIQVSSNSRKDFILQR